MRRALALVGMAAAVVAVAPSASASPKDGIAIRPGVGIGPIDLGMTGREVRQALGKPRAVITRRVFRGQPYVEFEWDYGAWNVGLLGRKEERRVVLVGTSLARHRTPEGLGVGTREARLWRELRGRLRDRRCSTPTLTQTHWVYRSGKNETIFLPRFPHDPDDNVPVTVGAVEVRTAPVLGCTV